MTKIFISYRREDSAGEARTLYKDLVENLGKESVFMDVDNIALGRDFRKVLDECLESCEIMLTLIGKDWLNVSGPSGRRLEDPGDFVRQEIASALKRGIPVAPVLLQGATMPSVEQLPEDLQEFAYRNGFELRHARWESDVQEMIRRLNLSQRSSTPVSSSTATTVEHPSVETPVTSSRRTGTGDSNPKSKKGYWLAIAGVLLILGGGLLYYQTTPAPTGTTAITGTTEPAPTRQQALAELIGTYRFNPMTNDWHEGQIEWEGDNLKWTNKAGVSWGLVPDFENETLQTDTQNPYYANGAREFTLVFQNDQLSGFIFDKALYQRLP